MQRTVTITLPEKVFNRLQETAQAADLSVEELASQSVSRSFSPFEADLSPEQRSALFVLSSLDDEALLATAQKRLDGAESQHLAELADKQTDGQLSPEEAAALEKLTQKSYDLMLLKAEALRLLTQRGHEVFPALELPRT